MIEFFRDLIPTITRIRGKIQLIALVVVVAGFIILRWAEPGALKSQFAAGAIGVSVIVFAQIFQYLNSFRENQRGYIVISLFSIFLTFIIICFIILFKGIDPPPSGSDSIIIDGKVMRSNKSPISDVKVVVDGTPFHDKTDSYGQFHMELRNCKINDVIKVSTFHPDFISDDEDVNLTGATVSIKIFLQEAK